MGWEVMDHHGTRAHHAVGADVDAAQDRHVAREPDAVTELDGRTPLRTFGVEGMLVGVEDAAAGADPVALAERQRLLRAQMTARKPAPLSDPEASALEDRQVHRLALDPQPAAVADLDAPAAFDVEDQSARNSLGHDVGADPELRAGRKLEACDGQVRARRGMDPEPRMTAPQSAKPPAVSHLDAAKQEPDENGAHEERAGALSGSRRRPSRLPAGGM